MPWKMLREVIVEYITHLGDEYKEQAKTDYKRLKEWLKNG